MLIAAGVVLRGDQNQARACWFGLRRASEGVQEADYGGVRRDDAESH